MEHTRTTNTSLLWWTLKMQQRQMLLTRMVCSVLLSISCLSFHRLSLLTTFFPRFIGADQTYVIQRQM